MSRSAVHSEQTPFFISESYYKSRDNTSLSLIGTINTVHNRGQGPKTRASGRTDGRTDGRTKYPLYSRGRCPSGATALLTIRKSNKKEKQGKGTADHILTLVDYFFSAFCPFLLSFFTLFSFISCHFPEQTEFGLSPKNLSVLYFSFDAFRF